MKDPECIFCKIAGGEIPSTTIYEDDDFRVIFDISPASFGHALILPKEHYANVYELGDDEASKLFVVAKKVATAIKEETGCDGINILQNNGEIAGQTIFHFHTHIIPRYKGDSATITWKHLEPEMDKLSALAENIKSKLQ